MSTTVSAKITEIKGLIDIGYVTDTLLLLWLNQFENSIYNIKNEYKTIWYPRLKNLSHYNIPKDNKSSELIMWNDIRSVQIKDSNGEFQTAKKITQCDFKTSGLYYWYENTNIAIPPPDITDNDFRPGYSTINIINKSLKCETPTLSVRPEITSNSIKSVNVDFTTYFIPGMVINLKCSSVNANNGEYIIKSVTSGEIVLETTKLTPVANDTYLIIEGAAVSLPHVKTNIIKDSNVVIEVIMLRPKFDLKLEYFDYYSKVINVKENIASTVLSFGYGDIPDVSEINSVVKVFVPGIKITYKPVYYSKSSISSTDELILPEQFNEAYNYFIFSKIYEMLEEYEEAKYNHQMAFSMIEQYEDMYNKDEAYYPADDHIITEW